MIPAHGSGVASALYAGHLAAKVGASALKQGETSTRALWPYSHKYQSGRGATLACYDVNKLVVESLTNDQLSRLMEYGVMAPEDTWNAAVPKPVSMSLRSLPGRVIGLIKAPDLLGPVVDMGMSIATVKKHYKNYPREYDCEVIKQWKEKAAQIFAPLSKMG